MDKRSNAYWILKRKDIVEGVLGGEVERRKRGRERDVWFHTVLLPTGTRVSLHTMYNVSAVEAHGRMPTVEGTR